MSPAERETLLARLAEALRRRPEVLEAYLFGSTARGESRPRARVAVESSRTLDRLHLAAARAISRRRRTPTRG